MVASEDLDAIIADIERFTSDGAGVDELAAQVARLLTASRDITAASIFKPGLQLYRATNHHGSVPKNITELWFPPVDRAGLGRANRERQPMFYCTTDRACAFKEIDAMRGQFIVLAKWITTAPMTLRDLGFTDQVLTRAGARRNLPRRYVPEEQARFSETARKARDFLAIAFTQQGSDKYRLTAAIAAVYLQAPYVGLLYPPVSMAANFDNVVLRPSFVREHLQLQSAELVYVRDAADDGIEAELYGKLEAGADGKWGWAVKRGTPMPFPERPLDLPPAERVVNQNFCEKTLDGKKYQLEPGHVIERGPSGTTVRDPEVRLIEPVDGVA